MHPASSGRQTVFQLLNETLKLAGRKTFLHRFIYAGQHKSDSTTEELFTDIITEINENYVDEPLTGLLLLYSNHFMHIIDGSESSIIKHFFALWENKEFCEYPMKLLIIYHHINQRMFEEWGCRRAKPPILLEKIDPLCDFNDMKRYLEMCIKKIYNLAIALRSESGGESDGTEKHYLIGQIVANHSQYLPEYNLLDYLLHNDDIYNLNKLHQIYTSSDSEQKYDIDMVWPVRSEFIPFNVFEKEINVIPYLFPPKQD